MIKNCLEIQEVILWLSIAVIIYKLIGYFKSIIEEKSLANEVDELLKENISLVTSYFLLKTKSEKLESDNENLKMFSCSTCKIQKT